MPRGGDQHQGSAHQRRVQCSGERHCQHTCNIVIRCTVYCVLVQVGDDRRARLKYLGTRLSSAQLRAGGGVPCSLAQGEGDCFLGAGVYSDGGSWVVISASKSSIRRFVITEKALTRAFSWLKSATTAFTFKTLLRHYAEQVSTPRSLNVKLGPRHNYHEGRAAIRPVC